MKQVQEFKFTFFDFIKTSIKNHCRSVQRYEGLSSKETFYHKGIKMIKKELDMVRYLKKLKIADTLASITLSSFEL